MSKWLRWWDGSCRDGKFQVVSRNASVTVATVIGVWAALLEDASNDDHRGTVTQTPEWVSLFLGLTPIEVTKIIEAMKAVGLVCDHEHGLEIINWNKRQFESDGRDNTNADRQRRWRNRHRNGPAVTQNDQSTDTENRKSRGAHSAPAANGRLSKGTPLPASWKPSEEDISYAGSKGLLGHQLGDEIEKFRNHWTSKSGRDACKRDWHATWRNWVLNSRHSTAGRRLPPPDTAGIV